MPVKYVEVSKDWISLCFPCFHNQFLCHRREEKLYVEGMEDEDMKKETQNLAYPPAFKVAPISISLDVKSSPCSWRWPCSPRSTASTPPPRSSTLPGGGSLTGCDRWQHLRSIFVLLIQYWNENIVKIDIIQVYCHCPNQIPKLEELISKGHMKKMTGRWKLKQSCYYHY